jgi:hypothetical protein
VKDRAFRDELPHGGILHDKCVNSRIADFPQHCPSVFELILVDYRIEGDINADSEAVGVIAERPDVLNAVGGSLPRPEAGTGYTYRIGTAVYGCDADG